MIYYNPKNLIDNNRKAVLHIAQQELNLDRETYETILFVNAGVTTSKKLTNAGYDVVMEVLKSHGFKPRPGKAKGRMSSYRKPNKSKKGRVSKMGEMASPEQQKTIIALWEDWADVKTHAALRHWLEKRFGVSDIYFLTLEMAIKVTEALKAMIKRKNPNWDGIIG